MGAPARQTGWMSRHGHRLGKPDADGLMRCPESGYSYKTAEAGRLRCLDLDEEAPLPAELASGIRSYDDFKSAPLVPARRLFFTAASTSDR
jgi:UDP-2-acetamido-3-amino-2,3-dideoxy-glucuronate N-acetyltransferase